MSKIVLNDVTNINSLSVINDNFDKIEQALQNEVFFRDNVSGETNTIEQTVDFNGVALINVGSISTLSGDFGTIDQIEAIRDEVEADRIEVASNTSIVASNTVTVTNTAGDVEDIFNDFNNTYLGAFAVDPVLDNQGATLVEGALYFYTGLPNKIMRIYNGATWQDVGSFTSTNVNTIDPSLYASQAESEAGVNNAKVVTPLRVKQAIDARTDLVKTSGTQTVGGVKTFTSLPESAVTPTTSNQFVRKADLDALGGSFIPPGFVGHWPGTTAPAGWLARAGQLVSRATYSALYAMAAASGNIVSEASWPANPGSFSVGDGSTTFRLPDARGLTDKGHHSGSGTYTTNTTRALGSYEADENKAHVHTIANGFMTGGGPVFYGGIGANANVVGATDASGAAEATIRNASYLPIIKT